MDIGEILNSAAFWVLTGIGVGTFVIMLLILKGMGQGDMMPWWVKIITFIFIPIIAAALSGYASGD